MIDNPTAANPSFGLFLKAKIPQAEVAPEVPGDAHLADQSLRILYQGAHQVDRTLPTRWHGAENHPIDRHPLVLAIVGRHSVLTLSVMCKIVPLCVVSEGHGA